MIRMVRGIITEVTEAEIKRFSGTGVPGETFVDRELFQQYGFASRPKANAEFIALKQDGVVYAVASDDRRYRISLEEGEVALYSDEGDLIHLKRGKEIHIQSGNKVVVDGASEVEVNGAAITLNGDVTMNGNVEVDGTIHSTGDINSDGSILATVANSNKHSHP